MRFPRSLALVALLLPAGGLAAQNPQCAQYNQVPFTTQDYNICNAAIDGTEIFHPVAGLLVSGGNPVLGSVGTLGGFPHLSITARVNATQLKTPDLNYDGSTTTVPKGDQMFAPAPLVEAGLGVFKGVNGGFLAFDLLGSAQLLPTNQIDNLSIDKGARKIGSVALGLGYGLRVAVLKGRAIIPNVTVSAMRRDIPRITYGDVTSGGDNYSYSIDLHATNLRAVGGYHLGLFNVGAGLGWDKYTGTANIEFVPQSAPLPQTINKIDLDNTRTMAFLQAALDFPVVKIAAEAGYQFGKDPKLATSFQGNDPSKSRLFAGGGIRLSF